MIILGIDPGMAETGWGIIDFSIDENAEFSRKCVRYVSHGLVKTESSLTTSSRLLIIRDFFREIISKYEPECVALERLFFGRNVQTAMSVERARGVLMVTAAEKNIDCFEYQPLVVKKILSGTAKLDKEEVEIEVKKFLRLKKIPKPNHAADALAVAICHAVKFREKPKDDKRNYRKGKDGKFIEIQKIT